MLAAVLRDREVSLLERKLDPDERLPHTLDYFSLSFALTPMTDRRRVVR